MPAATATARAEPTTRRPPPAVPARRGFRSAGEMREVIDRVLTAVNADERSGPLLQATGLRLRIECPDVGCVVAIAASDEPGDYIRWRFDRRGSPRPKLVLTMDSDVANAWLQGAESVPMAIAHRRMKAKGDARAALLYLPALKLISRPYRRIVRADFPRLAL